MPEISLGSWIRIEKNINAVVSSLTDDENVIEVVYLSEGNKAINDMVIYNEGTWKFLSQQRPSGGYADKYPRLQEYVAILRRGRYS